MYLIHIWSQENCTKTVDWDKIVLFTISKLVNPWLALFGIDSILEDIFFLILMPHLKSKIIVW
jgi:hypothetical protein